jgi:SAM-dependent methyltransferase
MIVVKIGGGEGIDFENALGDLASRRDRFVLVHGGSDELNRLSERLGKQPRFVTSPSGHTSRYTDKETLEMFQMVYCGSANKRIVERFQEFGVNAVGLSGIDGRILIGTRKSAIKVVENGKRKVGKTGAFFAYDIDEKLLQVGKALTRKAGSQFFIRGDQNDLSFAENTLDWVIINDLALSPRGNRRVFEEAYRVLKPGGTLLVARKEGRKSIITSADAKATKSIGFDVGAVKVSTPFFVPLPGLPGTILPILPLPVGFHRYFKAKKPGGPPGKIKGGKTNPFKRYV